MRVLLISETSVPSDGGWGRYTFDLANHLEKRGVSVAIVAARISDTEKRALVRGILPSAHHLKRLFFGAPQYALQLWKHLRREGIPDLVHCTTEEYAPITFLIAWMLGIPYIVTVHGSRGVYMLEYPVIGRIQRLVYQRAHTVVCVSRYTKQKLEERGVRGNRKVITSGVDTTAFLPATAQNKIPHQLLGVGGLKRRKGYHVAIAAVAMVKERFPDVTYVIVGTQQDQAYVSELAALIEKLGLSQNVRLAEGVSNDELKRLYQESSLFVLPHTSLPNAFDGFGLVYLEANVYGLPAIGAYGSGAEDAINDGVTGYLCEPNNPAKVAEKITALFNDEELYSTMARAAIAWGQGNDWKNRIESYLELYREAIPGAPVSPHK